MGVNKFVKKDEEIDIPLLEIGDKAETLQLKALADLRIGRNENAVKVALIQIQEACANGDNIMPPIVEAAKIFATMGEIVVAMKSEFGEWQESAIF